MDSCGKSCITFLLNRFSINWSMGISVSYLKFLLKKLYIRERKMGQNDRGRLKFVQFGWLAVGFDGDIPLLWSLPSCCNVF